MTKSDEKLLEMEKTVVMKMPTMKEIRMMMMLKKKMLVMIYQKRQKVFYFIITFFFNEL